MRTTLRPYRLLAAAIMRQAKLDAAFPERAYRGATQRAREDARRWLKKNDGTYDIVAGLLELG